MAVQENLKYCLVPKISMREDAVRQWEFSVEMVDIGLQERWA